ncbi:2-iminobutanoate/2-iminopropanoate deaminase [Nocardia sp. GAS34]|uniref:RidA family protein n=1 Tax=unclassified Nocardia TaxID=2637762 RepID=UPI003D262379
MQITSIEPQHNSYGQGALLTGADRLLFISGQVPESPDGKVPRDFEEQARLAWRNVANVLAQAEMTLRNLVKITVFLADRGDREANARVRDEVLGGHCPALTVIITGIYDESWLLEIEAIAAAGPA